MRLESVTLSGFRCFGPDPITVSIAPEVTAVVGPNAAGKTALLHALSKLFGVSRAQRTVQRSDFHVGAADDPDDREPKDLFIDVLIALPELADGTATPETIAPSFRHMQLERDAKAPVCRLRLEARWEDDGTVEGGFRRSCSGSTRSTRRLRMISGIPSLRPIAGSSNSITRQQVATPLPRSGPQRELSPPDCSALLNGRRRPRRRFRKRAKA